MQLRFGGAHIRALLDELAWQTNGQRRRQPQRRELQVTAVLLIRKAADQRQQHMVLLLQLLLQRRQCRLRRRHLRFLSQYVGTVGGADYELIAHDFELVGFRLDDFLGRLDLTAQ